jgi:hypothetical protein
MIKKIAASLIGVAMCLSILAAQGAKPYSYSLTKKGEEALFTGKTYDEVWEAASNALLMLKYNISVAQKDSGMITAVKGPSTGTVFMLGMFAHAYSINLIIKKQDDGIGVLGNGKGAKRHIPPVYDQMGKLLYGD